MLEITSARPDALAAVAPSLPNGFAGSVFFSALPFLSSACCTAFAGSLCWTALLLAGSACLAAFAGSVCLAAFLCSGSFAGMVFFSSVVGSFRTACSLVAAFSTSVFLTLVAWAASMLEITSARPDALAAAAPSLPLGNSTFLGCWAFAGSFFFSTLPFTGSACLAAFTGSLCCTAFAGSVCAAGLAARSFATYAVVLA